MIVKMDASLRPLRKEASLFFLYSALVSHELRIAVTVQPSVDSVWRSPQK